MPSNPSARMLQRLLVAAVVVGWLYILAFTLHPWQDRVFFGGLIIAGVTAGLLFERWRWRGDRRARTPFLAAAAAFVAGISVASIGPREFGLAGVIAAAGSLVAWALRAGPIYRDGRG
ncbi:MAG: hypothetical protein ACRDOD_22410 [Streptosporangiaceae bacterium]